MSDSHHPDKRRLFDLLADEAVQPLSFAERVELNELLQRFDDVSEDDFAQAAAAFALAFEQESKEALPKELQSKLESDAQQYIDQSKSTSTESSQPDALNEPGPNKQANESGAVEVDRQVAVDLQRSADATKPSTGFSLREGFAWLVAAASLLFALGVFDRGATDPVEPTLSQKWSQFTRNADDLIQADWSAGNVPETDAATGAVVWSTKQQQGFMSFAGLKKNDPTKEQYQLWIFDDQQKNPVDGGVFDVTDGDVIIPIDSKLNVVDVTMFAVTIEKPGGVVVSDKSRIALLAKL